MVRKLPLFSSLGKILKLSIGELYSSLGYMMLISIIWIISALPSIILLASNFLLMANSDVQALKMAVPLLIYSLLIISFWTGLVTGPVTSALYGIHQERKETYIGFSAFINSFKKSYWLSARVYWAASFGITLIIINFLITLTENSFFFKLIGIFSLYILFFLILMLFYLPPLIFYKHKWTDIFRKSFLLVIDNFWLCILCTLVIGMIFLLSIPTIILMFLIFGAFYINIIDNAFEIISEKYEDKEKTED